MLNTWQMYSILRSIKEIKTESLMGSQELMRYLNEGYFTIVASLWEDCKRYFYREKVLTDQATTTKIYVPDDHESGLRVFREKVAAGNLFKEATEINNEQVALLDKSASYVPTAQHPFYYIEGSEIKLYPALPVAPGLDVKLTYYRKPPKLQWGYFTAPSEFHDDFITLDFQSPWFDDQLIGQMFMFYKQNAVHEYWEKHTSLICTDNVASTNTAEFPNIETGNIFSASTKYLFSMVPALEAKYHQFIVDQARVSLISDGKIKGDFTAEVDALKHKIQLYGGLING